MSEGSRLTYTKGMLASLRLLLEDSRLDEDARSVVLDHFERCQATVGAIEGEGRA